MKFSINLFIKNFSLSYDKYLDDIEKHREFVLKYHSARFGLVNLEKTTEKLL